MAVFIDKKLVFQTVSLLLLDDQTAKVALKNGGFTLEAEICVLNDGGAQTIEVNGDKLNTVSITFRNWSSTIGTALTEATNIGTTRDKKHTISILAAIWRIGPVSRVEIQFMLEAIGS